MIFGDPSRFAVSMTLDTNYGGLWLLGKLCYWIGGQRVGDYDLGTSLRDALSLLTSIVRDCGHRESCMLFSLPAAILFSRLDTSLYGGHEPRNGDLVENAAVYDILPSLDVFRDWKAYLVECQGQARLLYQGPQPHVQEFILQSGEFDMVLRAAYAQVDALYEREVLLHNQ